jgi:hypothetical protein
MLFILNVGSVTLSPEGVESVSNVDFDSLGYSLDSSIQGVYEFSVTVEHNGSDSATARSVPIPWEKVYYELPLTNGTGILTESTVEHDLNGDGDIVDTFDVTWYNDTIRQWDAIIKDGTTDIHAYAITETPGVFPRIRNYSINGESKLFTLGSETHFLYSADNYTATFGFGEAYIYNHPGPNFELALYSSKINAINFKINGNPVEVDFSVTVKHIADYLVNSPTDAPIYVVPMESFDINPGEQITFSCTLIAHEATTFDLGLILNWSPDGVNRYYWVPVWDVISLEAINRPHFTPVDTTLTQVDSGVKQLMTTVKNIGAPATTGLLPAIWETLFYSLPLDGGDGTLDENIISLDLNGDGDTSDTFTVTWLDSPTRPCDANVDGKYVYAILDQPQSPWYNLTYYIDGDKSKPKLFQLGTKTHCLYYANAETAEFGLDGNIWEHPSPNFLLVSFSNISAENFKINGNPVEVNYTQTSESWYPYQKANYRIYNLPNQAVEIDTEEEITFSCNLIAPEKVTTELLVVISWSQDENIKYRWKTFTQMVTIETWTTTTPTTPTTTTTTTTTTITRKSAKTPGFTVLTALLLLIPLLIQLRRRKKEKKFP